VDGGNILSEFMHIPYLDETIRSIFIHVKSKGNYFLTCKECLVRARCTDYCSTFKNFFNNSIREIRTEMKKEGYEVICKHRGFGRLLYTDEFRKRFYYKISCKTDWRYIY
jgi:hypothetical protein